MVVSFEIEESRLAGTLDRDRALPAESAPLAAHFFETRPDLRLLPQSFLRANRDRRLRGRAWGALRSRPFRWVKVLLAVAPQCAWQFRFEWQRRRRGAGRNFPPTDAHRSGHRLAAH